MKSLKKTKLTEDSLEEREGKWEEGVNGKDHQDKVLETHSDQDQMADQEALEMAVREVPFTLKMVDQEDHFTLEAEAPGDLFILEV